MGSECGAPRVCIGSAVVNDTRESPEGDRFGRYAALSDLRVVICEDESFTERQIHTALERAGMRVLGSANNGLDGMQMVLRERPDVVLMDIVMSDMDGLEAARLILDVYPVCLVMLTALPDEAIINRAREIGVSAYIIKPALYETLLEEVQQAWLRYSASRHGSGDTPAAHTPGDSGSSPLPGADGPSTEWRRLLVEDR